MTKTEQKIRAMTNVDLLRTAFLTVETNAYGYAHRGSVSLRDRNFEDMLKAECVRRFAGVVLDREVTNDA